LASEIDEHYQNAVPPGVMRRMTALATVVAQL
jgi:hypothetical protein